MQGKRAPLAVIFLTVLIDVIGLGIIIPLQPFYVEVAGGSGAHVGALFGIYSLAQFLFVPVWGRVSDRIGRRPVILLTLLGTGIAFLVFAVALDSLVWLFVSRIAAGICGGNLAVAHAYVGDVTTAENRARGMGMVGAAFGLGFVLGPAAGGALAIIGPMWPPAAAGVLALANAVFAVFALPESLPVERRTTQRQPWRLMDPAGLRALRGRPVLGGLLLILFLSTAAFSNLETTFALLVQRNFDYGRTETSMLFVYIGLIAVAIQGGLLGRLVDRFGAQRLVVTGCVLLTIGLAALPALDSLPALLTACAVLAVGSSLNRPSINALVSLQANASEQGALLGTAASLASLARVVGPTSAGALWDLNYALPYQLGAAVMGIACVVAVAVSSRLGHKPHKPPDN